jgi:DnaJ-related protein SCJ1
MPDKRRVVFDNEGDESPDQAAGDVVFELKTVPHAVFVRQGDHLRIKKTISLRDALLGFEFKVKHLDGKEITIKREKVVTQPGMSICY